MMAYIVRAVAAVCSSINVANSIPGLERKTVNAWRYMVSLVDDVRRAQSQGGNSPTTWK